MNQVNIANEYFLSRFKQLDREGLQEAQYIRYLQMQYHLTKGVQETFLAIAAHPETKKYRKLRKFLIQFGYEEEMHFKLAEDDLKELNQEVGAIPFPVELWWEYQKMVVKIRPIERLGATAILENIGNYAAPIIKSVLFNADFISHSNIKFVEVHMHEELPHGDQIIEILSQVNWSDSHLKQLKDGAEKATWLYAKTIFDWIIDGSLKLAS